jgi:uncharacterized protein (AIM24 family)
LSAGQKYTLDTGHIIAFSEKLGFKVPKVGGLKSTLLSGEGLVVDLTGPGRFLLQTRSTEAFLAWLIPLLPKTKEQPIVENELQSSYRFPGTEETGKVIWDA